MKHLVLGRGLRPIQQKMRILGIDYGRSRVGLALTDPQGKVVQPLLTINQQNLWRELEKVIKMYEVEKVVVGLPVNMDGSLGSMAIEIRAFAQKLSEKTGIKVELVDERLTSFEAEQILREAGLNRKKRAKLVDKLSAALILERHLRERAHASGN